MLKKLQERLLKITEYHSLEWAQRLKDVGGPGVGGTELAYRPNNIQHAKTEDEYIRMALESSIPQTWEEAAWCYVYGNYRACILLSATLLEIALKYELYRQDKLTFTTLGPLIKKCERNGILKEQSVTLARSINLRRNDIIHANIQTDRPESLLHHTGEEHEHEPVHDLSRIVTENGSLTGDGEIIKITPLANRPMYSRVHIFKRAAQASLFDVRAILKNLYSTSSSEDAQVND